MNKKENNGTCDCLGNNGFHMHRGMTRRLALMILLVVIAFWFGMKLGEIKGFVTASYGYAPMHQRGNMYDMRDMDDRKAMPMKVEMPQAPASPAAPVN